MVIATIIAYTEPGFTASDPKEAMHEINANSAFAGRHSVKLRDSGGEHAAVIDGGPGFKLDVTVRGDAVHYSAVDGLGKRTGTVRALKRGEKILVEERVKFWTVGETSYLDVWRPGSIVLEDDAA